MRAAALVHPSPAEGRLASAGAGEEARGRWLLCLPPLAAVGGAHRRSAPIVLPHGLCPVGTVYTTLGRRLRALTALAVASTTTRSSSSGSIPSSSIGTPSTLAPIGRALSRAPG